jgi:hypothetical protein
LKLIRGNGLPGLPAKKGKSTFASIGLTPG